jgi:hypothetical protein
MSVKPSVVKAAVKLLCLALSATMLMGSVCFADDDEDVSDEGLPKKSRGLFEEAPKAKPKTKLIIKERVVEKMVCPSGSSWNPEVKKCQDEDGNDVVIAPKKKTPAKQRTAESEEAPRQQAKTSQVPDDKYIYPRTKVRVRVGQCIMTGEAMACDITYINTAPGNTKLHSEQTTIIDNLGNKFLATSYHCSLGFQDYCDVKYGNALKHTYKFTYLDTRATSVTFTSVIKANGETDLIKLENFPITK